MIPTQRPTGGPAARPLPEGAPQALRPAPALTAASLHIVLSSGRSWSSPGLDGSGRDPHRSPGPMVRPSPRSLPPRALARLSDPLRTAAAGSSERARAPCAQPSAGLVSEASVCERECVWERARACGRGSPRSPAEKGAGGGKAAPSRPLAAGPAPLWLPTSRRQSGQCLATLLHSLAKPDSRGVLLLLSPPRKRGRKARAPTTPTWGLVLSQ